MKDAETARAELKAALDTLKPAWIELPIIQPTSIYLELSGESIRRRAFLIDDGGATCLRPDLTPPAVCHAFAQPKLAPLVAYEGLVFRRQPPGSERETEHLQIGVEWLEAGQAPPASDVAAEAKIIAAALDASRAAGAEPALKLGDVALLGAFIEALGLAEPWPQRLARALARPGGLAALRAEKPPAFADAGEGLAEALANLPEDHAEGALRDLMAMAGITAVGGRPLNEIAARLRKRGQLAAAAPPTPAQYDALDALVHIDAPDGLERAARLAEQKLFARNGPTQAALQRAQARVAALKALTSLPANTSFAPGLGRSVAYYDGFVFELEAPALKDRASLGGGGRYDSLARALWPAENGKGRKMPNTLRAAGFALRPRRIAEAAP